MARPTGLLAAIGAAFFLFIVQPIPARGEGLPEQRVASPGGAQRGGPHSAATRTSKDAPQRRVEAAAETRSGAAATRNAGQVDLAAPPPRALSPRNASYSIDASLDPARALINGRETITWRNITPNATSVLQFHLYWNAWKNTRSTWMRESALGNRDTDTHRRAEGDWAWTDVTSIRLLQDGPTPFVDVTSRKHFIAPDDGNTDDETVLEVSLPAQVPPGETIRLEVEWQAHVPRTFARTGHIGNFFFIAQWFPKLGVLEPGGWNTHQFHASTEFYSDYGVYDVRLRVPLGWVVGATGREQERRDNGDGTTTHRYSEEDVHDFAWTTSPDLVERKARFEHAGLPPVDMRLLLQPEHIGQEDRHFAATRAALRYYGEWYGPYPYGHITIVDPAWQSGAGGMEYPTLFTAGTRWWVRPGVTQPEGVTVHEAGHQFWYGIVGNNEFEYAWLDEGFNTFSTARTIEQAFSPNYYSERFFHGFVPWVYRDIALARTTEGNGLVGYRAAAKADAQSTPSWRYFPSTGSRITYSKTALWLNTLERLIGWRSLQPIMSTFFRRSSFKHPKPDDFFAAANEVGRRDLTWFFDQVHRSSNMFDYAVSSLESRRRAVRGFVDREGGKQFATGDDENGPWETTVIVKRLGEATFPLDVQVTFENGESVRERWDGRDRWRAFSFVRPVKARSAQVDPDRVLLLDIDLTNNSRTLVPRGPEAATKWSAKWLTWLQNLLLTYGFFV